MAYKMKMENDGEPNANQMILKNLGTKKWYTSDDIMDRCSLHDYCTSGNVNNVMNRLVERGYAEKGPRRGKQVTFRLTKAGKKFYHQWKHGDGPYLAGLSDGTIDLSGSYEEDDAMKRVFTMPNASVRYVVGDKEEEPVNHPAHYQSVKYECIDVIEDLGLDESFNLGNAFKYLWRAGRKHNRVVEDLKKAVWYINREIEKLESKVVLEVTGKVVEE